VNEQPLEAHEISSEKAKEMVQESYNDSLKVTKKCLSALSQYRFIIEGKKTTDFEGFEQTNSGDDFYKDIIDSLLDDSISEEERNKNASEMFDKLPDMMSFFNEEKLKEAKKNPELWVKEMENKLFKSQIKKKKDLDKEKLRAEIDEQIKQSLRDAGMDVD
jgi:hypothetical protein